MASLNTMTEQSKAEAYVRKAIPELMELSFGCHILHTGLVGVVDRTYPPLPNAQKGSVRTLSHGEIPIADIEIIGHPIQLQHYLQIFDRLGKLYKYTNRGVLFWYLNNTLGDMVVIQFDPKTGQPESEEAYKAFNEIVGV